MAKRNLPIGIEFYKKVIDEAYFYVDKTLIIKELLDRQSYVNLFTRPRRFGKTLALDMLKTFFEDEIDEKGNAVDNSRYFADKKNIIASIAGIIHKGKGNINIAKIAEEVGYNQRYLDRVFKEAVGVSMKKYAEIIRIQKAIYYLQNSLTYEIYERLGYYDQAHFIKDFKKNTSLTPSRFERANSQYKIV